MAEDSNLVELTAYIVESVVGNNNVSIGEIPGLIKSVHDALSGLGSPVAAAEPEKPKGAVSVRKSVQPDGLVSMIDGKKYQTLRRHITRHGYTPESYRSTFGLPADYPLTSANYSELRRGMAKLIGLGRKTADAVVEAVTPEPAKPARKPRAAKPAPAPAPAEAAPEPVAARKRGRPRKDAAAATK